MLKKPTNFENAKAVSDKKKLPVGAYVCKVLNVEANEYNTKDGTIQKLELSFDIIEGEYKDFYKEQYSANTNEDKKWKGVIRLNIPSETAAEDDWSLRNFKTAMFAFEDSNNGYHFDWDEQKLKGKVVGILFRNKEYEFNGRTGFWTEPFKCINAESVRNETWTMPKDKLLENKTPQVDENGFMAIPDDASEDDGLPF